VFPHRNMHKCTWTSLMKINHNGQILIDKRRHSKFANLYTKFDGTTLLKLSPVHFRNAHHKHSFTSDALKNRVAAVAISNLYWVYGRVNLTAMWRRGSSIVGSCTALPVSLLFYHTTYVCANSVIGLWSFFQCLQNTVISEIFLADTWFPEK
jgi:hypothetical protein